MTIIGGVLMRKNLFVFMIVAMKNFRSLRAVLLSLVLLCPVGAFGAGFTNMYIIGDSLSDQGNMFYATQSLTGFGLPATDHYWMGRFANGYNYIDTLSDRMGITSTNSLSGGNNFADGGARVDYNIVELDSSKSFPVNLLGQGGILPENAFPWTLDAQRTAFANREVDDPDALFVVFAGANDLNDLITMVAIHSQNPMFPDPQPTAFMGKMLQSINQAIAAYVASGARNILVPNVPNLGAIPAVTVYGPNLSALAAYLTAQYNDALASLLSQWEALGYVNIIPFDTYSFLTQVVNNPAAYGFSNATAPCYTGFVSPAGPGDTACDTPESYVFWDREHPTTAAHAVLADRMRAAIVLDILDDLINRINNVQNGIPAALQKTLGAKLEDARKAFTDSNATNDVAAAGSLGEFIDLVKAQAGKKIPLNTANYLIGQTEKIIPLIAS
ncbi:MAG TPA: SGNH/GDSL hydrolase family protein, partial [Saprospiraceae bacterium]|nr:SGNH/GDSL hydrolase family protein [Saprospiraceae bacterium]